MTNEDHTSYRPRRAAGSTAGAEGGDTRAPGRQGASEDDTAPRPSVLGSSAESQGPATSAERPTQEFNVDDTRPRVPGNWPDGSSSRDTAAETANPDLTVAADSFGTARPDRQAAKPERSGPDEAGHGAQPEPAGPGMAPNAWPFSQPDPAPRAGHNAPAASAETTAPAGPSPTSGEAERPDNPFAPKAEETSRRRVLPWRKSKPEPEVAQPQGKRVAEKREWRPWRKRKDLEARAATVAKPRRAMNRRDRVALLISALAVVSIIALVVSYSIWTLNRPQAAKTPAAPPSGTPGPVLVPEVMLSEAGAKEIDPSRTWQENKTYEGIKPDTPGPVCVATHPNGQPTAQASFVRLLTASGEDRSAVLNRADAYSTPEEAAQVFKFRSTELGDCAGSPFLVERGYAMNGFGNQAVGVRVVLEDQVPQYHTLAVVRTGRVVDVVDITRVSAAVPAQGLSGMLRRLVNAQCGSAVGLCTASNATIAEGVPPAGGDQPGYLTTADLPRVHPGAGAWKGGQLQSQVNVQDGSGCEAVDFNTVAATARGMRTYILRNDPQVPSGFGVDEVILTQQSPTEAAALMDKINQSVGSCQTRVLTAQATPVVEVKGKGAGDMEIRGAWYTVTQKLGGDQTTRYRLGVVAVGPKMVYLRTNITDQADFKDQPWANLLIRAAERASQAS